MLRILAFDVGERRIGVAVSDMLGITALCFYPAGFNDYLILPLCVIVGFGMSGCLIMPWIIFPDVVDKLPLVGLE